MLILFLLFFSLFSFSFSMSLCYSVCLTDLKLFLMIIAKLVSPHTLMSVVFLKKDNFCFYHKFSTIREWSWELWTGFRRKEEDEKKKMFSKILPWNRVINWWTKRSLMSDDVDEIVKFNCFCLAFALKMFPVSNETVSLKCEKQVDFIRMMERKARHSFHPRRPFFVKICW